MTPSRRHGAGAFNPAVSTPEPSVVGGEVLQAPPSFTRKQMGDACEMLVAAELTLAGVPALKVPDNWPHYDVIAQPLAAAPQRISVKSRTYKRGSAYVSYYAYDSFDWLAAVILSADGSRTRSIYLIPRQEADRLARRDKETSKTVHERYYRIDEMEKLFSPFRDNFSLQLEPKDRPADTVA